ncbi:MAG: undecaprenyl-phosphate glucose phosphotransferase [Chloroflexi bacterium]|nr:undecaprenyl-phosphate glucose phosphotransferase [Chloroflexota bacterium]
MDRRPWISLLLALLMGVLDVAMVAAALGLAYWLRFETALLPAPEEYHAWSTYLPLMLTQAVMLPVVFATRRMYALRRNTSRLDELLQVFIAVSLGMLLALGLLALFPGDPSFSRAVLAIAWLLAVALVWSSRLLQLWLHGILRRAGLANERVLLVGSGPVARAVMEKMHTMPTWGYRVVGYIADGRPSGDAGWETLAALGDVADIEDVVRRHGITEVIIAEPALSHGQLFDIVRRLDPRTVSIKVFPDVFQLIASPASISDLHGLPLVSVHDAALRGWRLAVKRVVDVSVGAAVLVLLSPLMLLMALLIKLTSPGGPVFYVQERVGLDGRPFWVLKFRSMRPDAEATTGPVWASRGDPRATPLGRFMRRFSIDELQQFVNVLVGDMSIVGPRPERPQFVEQFSQRIPNYLQRHREKVGLTGWAQVNGLRGDTSIEERTAYDLWYVENWTLWLDFKIMLRTIFAIFKHSNG